MKKTEAQLALAKEQIKLQLKELEGKDAERVKAEQAAYDVGMTKTAQSLIAQLWDVTQAFWLEMWGGTLNAAGVDASSGLKGTSSVYYPSTFRIAPNSTPPMASSTPAPSKLQSLAVSSFEPSVEKEKQGLTQVVELEAKEAEASSQPKGKGKEKEKKAVE